MPRTNEFSMFLIRNNDGIWIARYKGVAYYTFSSDIAVAIEYALKANGRMVDY